MDKHRPLSGWEPGTELPGLAVTPDAYLTVRYAGASGDFNPIHVDEAFAQSVGLPGRILHGLWTMAQVARAHTEAAGGPERLRSLSVEFRGMAVPEAEVQVSATVSDVAEGVAGVASEVRQDGKRVIRNGRAEVAVGPREAEPAEATTGTGMEITLETGTEPE